ncbi:hypothetical protein KCU73_g3032, partial [Aureobasidium melanogenum]
MLLGTTTWTIIIFNTTRALIPLIVATILLSMIEGALVFAVIKAINIKPLDCESHDPPILLNRAAPSNPAGSLDRALIHPAFRHYSEGSLSSTRNFSQLRERCLDIMPACNAPAISVPRPDLATDTISRTMSTHRPVPPLPAESDNAPAPLPHLEEVNDITILPLHIQKRDSATDETAVKLPEDVVEKAGSKPGAFDATPIDLSSMSEAEKIITGHAAEQDIQEEIQARVEPNESDRTESQTPQTPDQLVAPIIVIQEATPTTPKSIQYPRTTLAKTPTIPLVNPYLEIPAMTRHGSHRKK